LFGGLNVAVAEPAAQEESPKADDTEVKPAGLFGGMNLNPNE